MPARLSGSGWAILVAENFLEQFGSDCLTQEILREPE